MKIPKVYTTDDIKRFMQEKKLLERRGKYFIINKYEGNDFGPGVQILLKVMVGPNGKITMWATGSKLKEVQMTPDKILLLDKAAERAFLEITIPEPKDIEYDLTKIDGKLYLINFIKPYDNERIDYRILVDDKRITDEMAKQICHNNIPSIILQRHADINQPLTRQTWELGESSPHIERIEQAPHRIDF